MMKMKRSQISTHRFVVVVKTRCNRRMAELAILKAFALRPPDGMEFILRRKPNR